MTYPDPAAYGSFDVPKTPPRFDRCPECGAALEWAEEGESTGGPDEWVGHGAECGCGMRYSWRPNQSHLRQKRRHEASERWERDTRLQQMRLEVL